MQYRNAERMGCRMKIEKVNENQIRCTLTREDLISRELKISELAYGTEKAKNLFRDMMRQANFEFGFEAEDIPLMIEAIPLNAECIVLIITKVEDPEELDTRFARFAPSVTEDEDDEDYEEIDEAEVADLFHQIQTGKPEQNDASAAEGSEAAADDSSRTRLFRIGSIGQAITLSGVVAANYKGLSTLYKNETDGSFLLLLTQGDETREAYDRVCNTVSEYGAPQRTAPGCSSFLSEHYDALIKDHAFQTLGGIG